jgi:two-component system sensor histidine kinase PhoQ
MRGALHSLSSRILLSSLLLLCLFLGVSGLYLERSHRLSIEAAAAERLQLQVLALLAQAEYDRALTLPRELIDARLSQPNSGLYARVLGADGAPLWQSPSTIGAVWRQAPEAGPPLPPGTRDFRRTGALFRLAYQVLWETADGREVPLRFEVLESTTAVDADLKLYRRHLLIWLGGSAALLALCQLAILGWSLRPLRRLAADITAIEAGTTERLAGRYPREVQAVTDNLNTLLDSEQRRRERSRNTLADLAHSLKTPLAVLHNADSRDPAYPELVREQAARMQDIVAYQLQRTTGGTHHLLRSVEIAPLAQRLGDSLAKVYAGRTPHIDLAIPAGCRFRGDQRDLMEMLGNLMDNACKYGAGEVRVCARQASDGLQLEVHDNGGGIAPSLRERVMQRGVRADSRDPGQGIGLAVVRDIADSYGGQLVIDDSPLGGACLRLQLPA